MNNKSLMDPKVVSHHYLLRKTTSQINGLKIKIIISSPEILVGLKWI
jgi:hypothetical protein